MSFVIGRGPDGDDGAVGHLGAYRARDGSTGAKLGLDFDGPHATVVVGKRGYGKSYTMGVLAEGLARATGVTSVIVDPMGVFGTLADSTPGLGVPVQVIDEPTVPPDAIDPRSWCTMVGLSPESGAGSVLWQAAQQAATIEGMQRQIESTDAPATDRRAAANHLQLAASWGVFESGGVGTTDLGGSQVTVLDVSELDSAAMNAICRAVAGTLYRGRIEKRLDRLPWLLVDEAHTFFDGIAGPALETILTRGRAPGVSLVTATQRPSAVPEVAISQSDILIAHRLTAQPDLDALGAAQPTYLDDSLAGGDRLPERPGEVLIVDDATETVHAARIRERETPHGGGSPSASDVRE